MSFQLSTRCRLSVTVHARFPTYNLRPITISRSATQSQWPPSENESGVTLTIPMIRVRLPNSRERDPQLMV